jgi:hypothetical protein
MLRHMKRKQRRVYLLAFYTLSVWHAQRFPSTARAGEIPPETSGAKAVIEQKAAESRIKLYGHIDAGFTYNPDHNSSNENFGRLFDDRQNEPLLNQITLTLERTLDPKVGYDWGFKVQGLFGSDARFIHAFSVLDNTMHEIVQPDVLEAYGNVHFPIITEGGIDLKIGQFVTLEGAEVIDATGNFFYSHSMIFNFGIPLKHTGAMVTTHVNKYLDVYTGVVRGVNAGASDNNDVLSFHGGVGLNLLEGKLTILASTSDGAENDSNNEQFGVHTNSAIRQLHDITTIWKITDKLTTTLDLNYGQDDGFHAEWYGGALYLVFAATDWLNVGARGEIWRDDDGFAVLQSGNNEDFVKLQRGMFDNIDINTKFGSDSTYYGITVGTNIKVPHLPKPVASLVIRPELRYDVAVGGMPRYNDNQDRDQFTAGIDVILSF